MSWSHEAESTKVESKSETENILIVSIKFLLAVVVRVAAELDQLYLEDNTG